MSTYHERSIHAWTDDSVRLVATPSNIAKRTLYYVQEVGHFRTMEPYLTEREQLDSYLIVYTQTGNGQLTYREKTYTLHPHQVFFIDCMEYQHYKTAANETWEILWVHLNGDSIRGYYELFAENSDPVISLSLGSSVPFLIQQLIRIQQHKSIRNELIASKLIVEMLTELVLTSQDQKITELRMPNFINELIKKLNESFSDKITLEQLANQFSVSKFHLSKVFKDYTGFSPNDYLINIRITHAKELLKYSDLPVSEIALKVGVDNVSHFINLFKSRVGHTPLAYRKKWQRP